MLTVGLEAARVRTVTCLQRNRIRRGLRSLQRRQDRPHPRAGRGAPILRLWRSESPSPASASRRRGPAPSHEGPRFPERRGEVSSPPGEGASPSGAHRRDSPERSEPWGALLTLALRPCLELETQTA